METIIISKISDISFRVVVEASTTTEHRVSISESYYRQLTNGKVSHEELLRKSFEFLLRRESNTSILTSFELPLIGRYFPDYERIIKSRLEG